MRELRDRAPGQGGGTGVHLVDGGLIALIDVHTHYVPKGWPAVGPSLPTLRLESERDALILRGETSRVGGTTQNSVLLRRDASGVQVVDFAAGGRAPSSSLRFSFSAPEVVWGVGNSPASFTSDLLRSDDGGVSWEGVRHGRK